MILQADARRIPLRDGCVQTVVTSPPYWGLRDYGTARWEGGDEDCEHSVKPVRVNLGTTNNKGSSAANLPSSMSCPCGATRIDLQIGLEPTPEAYVATMVEVFREVRRVLRDDGTCWVNLGDSFYNYRPGKGQAMNCQTVSKNRSGPQLRDLPQEVARRGQVQAGLKEKDLCGIPWRVAFALQADGWYLRSDIIWAKKNCMPESVRDRPTRSHEFIFLLAKSETYYYDADAIKEPGSMASLKRLEQPNFANQTGGAKDYGDGSNRGARNTLENLKARVDKQRGHGRRHDGFNDRWDAMEKLDQCSMMVNKRDVWHIAGEPTPEAHFAVFPEKLVEPCILAGSLPIGALEPDQFIESPIGQGEREYDPSLVTGRAGFNRPRRSFEGTRPMTRAEQAAYAEQLRTSANKERMRTEAGGATTFDHYLRTDKSGARAIPLALLTTWIRRGWLTPIDIAPIIADISRSTVLDPFLGSGTVGRVAERFGRRWVGLELSSDYIGIAEKRTAQMGIMFGEAMP